jgi:hypothetical protein
MNVTPFSFTLVVHPLQDQGFAISCLEYPQVEGRGQSIPEAARDWSDALTCRVYSIQSERAWDSFR